MSPRRIEFDFVPRRRDAGKWVGRVLLGAGALALLLVGAEYRHLQAKAAGLELRLEADASSSARMPKADPALQRKLRDAANVVAELRTPWGQLLADLEAADVDSAGSVALLGVEPDRERRKVKILAEARSLAAAYQYLQRLQRSVAVRSPLLQSHEVRRDDAEHPVRIEISADWGVRT